MEIVQDGGSCKCDYCKTYTSFVMPQEIIEAAEKGELILFCGAGISTESKKVLPFSFYKDILGVLNRDYNMNVSSDIGFAELMELFCETVPNGRKKLIRRIKERFDYIRSFPELYSLATQFHEELAKIPKINTVITTNWDSFFENKCGMSPIVDDKDISLWNTFSKRVFKVHGSINNIGSIVATTSDYEECYDRLTDKPIGSQLKSLLATHTVVFIGFSFGDEDLNKIIEILSSDLQDFAPQYFLITIDESWRKTENKNILPIITDAYYFLHSLKNILIDKKLIETDSVYTFAKYANEIVREVHLGWLSNTEEFNKKLKEYPELILSIAYQDGRQHAYQRCSANKKLGDYILKGYLDKSIKSYNEIVESHHKTGNLLMEYYNLGYLDGLINLQVFQNDNEEKLIAPCFIYQDEYFLDESELIAYINENRDSELYNLLKRIELPAETIPHFAPWYY
ncbi:SIR2 family protein [Lactococcus lactis]